MNLQLAPGPGRSGRPEPPSDAGFPAETVRPQGRADGAGLDGPAAESDPTRTGGALAVGLAAIVTLALGLAAWSALSAVDGAILAHGRVEAGRARVLVQHPEGGRVALLAVQDGQHVDAGSLLLRLDAGALLAERALLEAQRRAALARIARLTAERNGDDDIMIRTDPAGRLPGDDDPAATAAALDGQRRLFAARRDTLAGQLEQLARRRAQVEGQARGLAAQHRALRSEAALIAAELAREETLARRGLSPASRSAGLEREALRLAGAIAAADAEAAGLAARIAEIDLHAYTLRAARREEIESGLRDLEAAVVEIDTRLHALDDRLAGLDLRAPVAGRVHALTVAGVGNVLRPAEAALEIVPSGAGPRIAALVRPDQIDLIRRDQPVRLVLPATGGRRRDDLTGRIDRIAADSHEDSRTGARMFRIEVVPDPVRQPQAARGDHPPADDGHRVRDDPLAQLVPGLPVDVQIATGARSPLAWLLEPLTAYLRQALREARGPPAAFGRRSGRTPGDAAGRTRGRHTAQPRGTRPRRRHRTGQDAARCAGPCCGSRPGRRCKTGRRDA